ncbi:RTA1-like protein [Exidia glandulosa HHB12029]|uniref:RTA1-like protein n=1 Tax=Exidia glandulosa HHB12029 TaxID=1314781 RepID=A0A165C6N1_EXIGL|nr:RTA1-like protein [Exidia glandulosa HHB12029]
MSRLIVLVAVFALASAQRHAGLPPPPADPFADPRNDYLNPLRYIANNTLTAISVALVLAVGLAQTFLVIRYKTRWMLAMVIGCYTFALGLALRFGLHSQPRSHGLYIAEYLFVVLSPCAFIAAEYVLLGRLAHFLRADELLLIRPQRITKVFVLSDLSTFLVQATGGAISASANSVKSNKVGSRVFLVGLILQLISFVVFVCVFANFLARLRTHAPTTWNAKGWKVLLGAMMISFTGILVRSVYRVIELSQGYAGHLATTESYFYALDTLPLFVAISVFVVFWPGRWIVSPEARLLEEKESGSGSVEMGSREGVDGRTQ